MAASFETWMVDHAQKFFSAECAELGPEGTLAFIREMVQQARRHGLVGGPELCSYIDLAFTFGRDFETHDWATELVSEAAGRWSEFTMDALFEAAIEELDPDADLGVEDEEDFQGVEAESAGLDAKTAHAKSLDGGRHS